VVPTSDDEEAQEEAARTTGWVDYLRSLGGIHDARQDVRPTTGTHNSSDALLGHHTRQEIAPNPQLQHTALDTDEAFHIAEEHINAHATASEQSDQSLHMNGDNITTKNDASPWEPAQTINEPDANRHILNRPKPKRRYDLQGSSTAQSSDLAGKTALLGLNQLTEDSVVDLVDREVIAEEPMGPAIGCFEPVVPIPILEVLQDSADLGQPSEQYDIHIDKMDGEQNNGRMSVHLSQDVSNGLIEDTDQMVLSSSTLEFGQEQQSAARSHSEMLADPGIFLDRGLQPTQSQKETESLDSPPILSASSQRIALPGRDRRRSTSSSLSPPPSQQARLAPRPPSVNEIVLPPDEPPALDPALLAFQNARTFRRRTAIQLQPYTKEKTKYTAMVRKGGRLLIAELLHDDPDRAVLARAMTEQDSQFQEEAEAPDEDFELDMSVSPPVAPTDTDYDEYFRLYGEVADEDLDPRLQQLAKTRIREEEKRERKRLREDREAKRYMAFIERENREREKAKRLIESNERKRLREAKAKERLEKMNANKLAATAIVPHNSAHRHGHKRPIVRSESEAELPKASGRKRQKHASTGDSGSSQGSLRDNGEPRTGQISDKENDLVDQSGFYDAGNWDEYDPMFLDDSNVPDLTVDSATSPRRPLSSSRTVNLVTPRSSLPRSEESGSDDPPEVPKEKVKALKRVMPALLARRLADKAESDYQARQRRKALRVREVENAREQRPGQAVRRRGNGNAERLGVEDLFNDDAAETNDEMPHFALEAPPDPMIEIFSDNERGVESSSESDESVPEELYHVESVRHMEVGDFSRLLHGPQAMPRHERTARNRSTTLLRPAYHKRKVANRRSRTDRKIGLNRQERLHFPVVTQSGSKRLPKKRPRRKVLDDEAIFAVEPTQAASSRIQQANRSQTDRPVHHAQSRPHFNRSESHRSVEPVPNTRADTPHTPSLSDRHLTRTAIPVLPHESSDLWNEVQDFQIDFAIKPLQAGIIFHHSTYLGSGGFNSFVQYLTRKASLPSVPDVEGFGLIFTEVMPVSEFLAILPVVIDKMIDTVLAVVNDRETPSSSRITEVLRFIMAYLANATYDDNDIRQFQASFQKLDEGLQGIILPRSSRDRDKATVLLQTRFHLLQIYMTLAQAEARLSNPTAYDYDSSVDESITSLMETLLRYGFDRTMKPLKAVMALEADDGIVSEYTAECWVCVMHLMQTWRARGDLGGSSQQERPRSDFDQYLETAFDRAFEGKQIGPRASERIWYLTFGLACLSQFTMLGVIPGRLKTIARWTLVRKAMTAIRLESLSEIEETKRRHQLKPRDKYIKIMIIRCLQLSSIWQWHCDRESFAVATKDLGTIFRERALRNLPNEPSSDFPVFIRQFDRTLAEDIDMTESAYNLYLQLVCLCASDMVTTPVDIDEAKTAAAQVQRLMLSIFPFSSVRMEEGKIPSGRQLSALINRYSTSVIAALFDIKLLPYLLGNSKKWINFAIADTESRMACIRGMMYLGVAARHHAEPVSAVVAVLSGYFEVVRQEKLRLQNAKAAHASVMERDRLLILIVSCFRTLITTHSFDVAQQSQMRYPDPELLADCKFDTIA
jgi:hypothetical protein